MMELSKLNISSIAKEEIRRRFFHSRSAKNKTSDDSDILDQKSDEDLGTSEEEKPPKIKQEVQQTVVPQLDEETSASEDDGFPLITSVFSLALSSSGTEDEGCVFTDGVSVFKDGITNTTAIPKSVPYTTVHSSKDAPVSHQGSLPFVVKCSPNGIITVCSPPNPSSSTRKDNEDCTTITSSLKGSVCSTEFSDKPPASKSLQMFENTSTVSLPSSASNSNASVVTFIDATHEIVIPVQKLRSEVVEGLLGDMSKTLTKDNTTGSTLTSQTLVENTISCPPATVSSSIPSVQIPQPTKEVHLRQTVDTNLPSTSSTTQKDPTIALTNVNEADTTNERDSNLTESNKTDGAPSIANWLNKESSTPANSDTVEHASNDETINETRTPELCIKTEYIDQPSPTKQDEKIRQLKDLLRQKEAELEKFRFKGKTGSLSPAAQLRANFLKKNPSLCQQSRKLNANEGTESNNQIPTAISSNKDIKTDTSNEMDISCKKTISSKTESSEPERKISEKASTDTKISSTCSKQKNTKFTNQDKYKLVNVTILQGHTRTLAVPLDNTNSKTIYPRNDTAGKQSPDGKSTETTTRKRKQQTPKKVGPDRSKRKSNGEDITASISPGPSIEANIPVKLNTGSSNPSKTHLSKNTGLSVPITRTSPRRKQGNQSLETIPLKRKSPATNKLKTQDGPSAPKKVRKIVSAPKKTITKIIGPPSKSSSSLKPLTTNRSGQTTVPLTKSKTGATITKGNCSIKFGTRPITTTNTRATIQPSSTTSTTSKNITLNLKDPNQVANSIKRVLKGMPNEVFALVGNVSGCDSSKINNSPVTSSSASAKAIPLSNLAPVSHKASQESKAVNPTSATNTPDNGTCTTKILPATSKVPATMLTIPLMSARENNIRNELAKRGLVTHITSTSNVPNQAKVVIPVNIDSLKPVTTMTNQLTQPNVSSCQKGRSLHGNTVTTSRQLTIPLVKNTTKSTTVSVPVNLTTAITSPNITIPVTVGVVNSQMANVVTGLATTVSASSTNNKKIYTSNESPIPVNIPPPSSNLNQVSAVTVTKRNTNGHDNPGSSLSNLIAVVNTIASPVNSKPTSMIARPLAGRTVPVAITSKLPLSRKYASPNRPLAPKPVTPTTPQNTLLQPLAPKPTTPQSMSPKPLTHKPTSSQITLPKPFVRKPTTPLNTSPKLLHPKPTSPQSTSTKLTPSDPINQVIYTLPKPVMALPTAASTAFPENLSNGKILVYDVVQSNPLAGGRNPPVPSNDAAKLVVYVSNTGESRNLGIIKDNKIYLNTNQVAAVTTQPQVKSPVTPSASEFIPNPGDGDFKVLLGLEHTVGLMM